MQKEFELELALELHFRRALELQAEVSFRCASSQVALGGMYVVVDPFLRALRMLWRELGAKPQLAEFQLERGPDRELCLELEFELERKLEPGLTPFLTRPRTPSRGELPLRFLSGGSWG